MSVNRCSVPDCSRVAHCRTWCELHYTRWRHHGDVNIVRKTGPKPTPAEPRFWQRILVSPHGCWLWQGALVGGYGAFEHTSTHRWAYLHFVGQIPIGKELDHLCRNRACANPAHLEPVTRKENLRRGINRNSIKTHCIHGHPFTPANTRVPKSGGRQCKTCESYRWRQTQRPVGGWRKFASSSTPTN